MLKRPSWTWCWMVGAVLAAGASAQQYATIIDNLPDCVGNRNGRIISVSDATSDSDCSVGGAVGDARFVHPCVCDTLNALGPYWKAVGGAGGSGEATSVQGSATLPATCTELDLYQDTNSGGTEFYVCTAANTWTKTGTGDVLLAGDADGQTIQGRSGADKARVDIGETDPDQVTLIGPGATPGRVYAYSGGVYAVSPDLGTAFDLYDSGFDINTNGAASMYGDASTNLGSTSGLTAINGLRVNFSSAQTPPANANDACTAGDFIPTTGFIYFCTATDTWKRVAIATWP